MTYNSRSSHLSHTVSTPTTILGEQHFVAACLLPSDEKIILLTRANRLFAMSMDMSIDQLQLRASLHNNDGASSDDGSQSTTTSAQIEKRNSFNANSITDLTPGGYHCNSSGEVV